MKVEFEQERISELPGIVLISHGPAAAGMLSSIEMIYGHQDNMAAVTFEMGDDPAALYQELETLYEAFHSQCVFFADFYGGTPCNQLHLFSIRHKTEALGILGFNMPMILSAIDCRHSGCSVGQIVQRTLEDGKRGIQTLQTEDCPACEDDEA